MAVTAARAYPPRDGATGDQAVRAGRASDDLAAAARAVLAARAAACRVTDDGGDAVALRAVWVAEAGEVEVDFVSDLPAERVERHAARVLSLDVDASGLAEVGARDPVVGRLLAEAGGRRPVCFGTPFEAAVWAVLSQRVSMAQARSRQGRAGGRARHARWRSAGSRSSRSPARPRWSSSSRSRASGTRSSSASARWRRSRSAGDLDPAFLRGLELDDALTHLQSLPGIGPFGAMLVLARGAGHPDVPPPTLRRFRAAVARGLRPRRGARRGEARRAQRGLAPLPGVGDVAAAVRARRVIPAARVSKVCGCGGIGRRAAFRSP